MVLVGHSYAGLVVTAVADRIPERIAVLAYLDSGPVPDGAAYLDMQPPPAKQLIERLVEESGDGWQIPMPSWEELEDVLGASLDGLGDDERSRMRARAVAQPLRTWTQPVSLKNPARGAAPQAADHLQLPARPGAADDRRRASLVRRAGQPAVVFPGTAHRTLADVLRAGPTGRPAGQPPGHSLTTTVRPYRRSTSRSDSEDVRSSNALASSVVADSGRSAAVIASAAARSWSSSPSR